jgi:hypothetical protein
MKKTVFSRPLKSCLWLIIGMTLLSVSPRAANAANPKEVILKALKAMGGSAKVRKVKTLSLAIDGGTVKEFHRIRLKGRFSIYSAKRPSGRRLQIVLARGSAFVVDRDKDLKVLAIEDLKDSEVKEAGYDRDLFLLPLLLPTFLDATEAVLKDLGAAPNGDMLIEGTLPPSGGSRETSVRYTLRFSAKTAVLIGAKSVIPSGPEKGRTRKVVYRVYKKAGAILLPRELKYKVDEEPVRELKYRLKLDNKLPLTLFLKPRIVAKSGEKKK